MDWFFRPKVQLGLFVNLIFVIFTVVSPIFGERVTGTRARTVAFEPEPPPPSYVNLPPRKFLPQATSLFEPSTNQVSVYTKEDLTLAEPSYGGKLTLSPIFSVSGNAIKAPRTVLLRIYSFLPQSLSLPDECEVEVKGERGNFWASVKVVRDTTSVGDMKVEAIGVQVPYATFFGIVNSEHVTVRVGQQEVTLTPRQLEALRDMQRCIQVGYCL